MLRNGRHISILLLGGLAIQLTWEENHGDKQGGASAGAVCESAADDTAR
jgi:hypothetical protein